MNASVLEAHSTTGKTEPGRVMEHRWGKRSPCGSRVHISAGPGITGTGRLRDVSMSGAFVETALALPQFSQVTLLIELDDGLPPCMESPGVVVRVAPDGVGIEWRETASTCICAALGCIHRCKAPSPEM